MKKQMKFEKIICFIMLVSCALCFVFALGITTDIQKVMFLKDYMIDGYELYDNIQPFNRTLVNITIISIVITVFLFITKTHSRRKYYISNYIITGISVITNIVIAIWSISKLQYYKNIFLTETDFVSWKDLCTIIFGDLSYYTESTFWLDISIITFVLTIIVSLLLLFNLIWKITLIKYENNILEYKEAQL